MAAVGQVRLGKRLLRARSAGRTCRGILFLSLCACPLLVAGGRALAAGSGTVAVSAVVLSNSNCRFRTAAANLPFGALDPANPVDVMQTTSLTVRCAGTAPIATFLITDDDGLYKSGPGARRMRHATAPAEFLPYGLSYAPASATILKNADQTITITGSVAGADYRGALPGDFADTVTLSVVP